MSLKLTMHSFLPFSLLGNFNYTFGPCYVSIGCTDIMYVPCVWYLYKEFCTEEKAIDSTGQRF